MIKFKLIMTRLILLIGLFNLISSQTTEIPCTKDGYKKLDEVMSKLIGFGEENRKIPTTNDEMTEFCR